jgi:ABC-2 type transport system permease protein
VKRGDFDRILLRPRSTVLQLAGHELALRKVGRLLQGALILAWAAWSLDVSWTFPRMLLLAFTLVGGVAFFFSLFVAQATVCFWTVETLELMNVLTYGGAEAASYPLSIYGSWMQRMFTFVVPLACVAYFPIVAIIGREDPLGSSVLFQYCAPLAGLLFLGATLIAWRFGVRRYTSTGS